jgi:hypothetical protein
MASAPQKATRYNLLFRWFIGLSMDDPVWDPTTFTKNWDRLLAEGIADAFFAEVLSAIKTAGLLSDEHFTVDGTLLEAWPATRASNRRPGRAARRPTRRHRRSVSMGRRAATTRISRRRIPRRDSTRKRWAAKRNSRTWAMATGRNSRVDGPHQRRRRDRHQERRDGEHQSRERQFRRCGHPHTTEAAV